MPNHDTKAIRDMLRSFESRIAYMEQKIKDIENDMMNLYALNNDDMVFEKRLRNYRTGTKKDASEEPRQQKL